VTVQGGSTVQGSRTRNSSLKGIFLHHHPKFAVLYQFPALIIPYISYPIPTNCYRSHFFFITRPIPLPRTLSLLPFHSAPALEPGGGRGRERGRRPPPSPEERSSNRRAARRRRRQRATAVELGGEACRPALSAIRRRRAVESGRIRRLPLLRPLLSAAGAGGRIRGRSSTSLFSVLCSVRRGRAVESGADPAPPPSPSSAQCGGGGRSNRGRIRRGEVGNNHGSGTPPSPSSRAGWPAPSPVKSTTQRLPSSGNLGLPLPPQRHATSDGGSLEIRGRK
jgi:hypothetical protein